MSLTTAKAHGSVRSRFAGREGDVPLKLVQVAWELNRPTCNRNLAMSHVWFEFAPSSQTGFALQIFEGRSTNIGARSQDRLLHSSFRM
jgi:hypothetical protein